jgi:hypothetical protein
MIRKDVNSTGEQWIVPPAHTQDVAMPDVQFDLPGSEDLNVAAPALEVNEPVTYGQAVVGLDSKE